MEDRSGVSVIVPAHDEASSIARLLDALAPADRPGFEVVVVCNGCTDDTPRIARGFAGVRVVEIGEASKRLAVAEGDRQARYGTRAYVDADVLITQRDVLRLAMALDADVLATAPSRRIERSRVATPVAWYYDVWERLPSVRLGLFGRGVVVLSPAARERIATLPRVMSDDLLMSEAFSPAERLIVPDASVTVWPPRTLADLIRRRVRVATGNAQMDRLALRTDSARTSLRTLAGLLASNPTLAPKLVIFLGVTLVSRRRARRHVKAGDFTTWLRDDSSRTG